MRWKRCCFLVASCGFLVPLLLFFTYKNYAHVVSRDGTWHFKIGSETHSRNTTPFPAAPPSTPPPTTAPPNPVPPLDVLQRLSHKELQAFYHSYINSPQVACSKVVRMGKVTDGGWELCDDPLYRPYAGDCLVYSYGINFDYSYDDDMVRYGCEVHAFDPSMGVAPHIRKDRIFFHPTGIGPQNATIPGNKNDQWQVYTLASHRAMYHHSPNQRRLDIVKMDIEGHELASLNVALDDGSLADVRQLAFETHVTFKKTDPTIQEYLQFLVLLRKVYDHGFRIYATHRNYVWSAFSSTLDSGKQMVKCHEIHTVNINFKNDIKGLGGDSMAAYREDKTAATNITDAIRQQRYAEQKALLDQETDAYNRRLRPMPNVVVPRANPAAAAVVANGAG